MTGLRRGLVTVGVAAVFAAGWTGSSALQAVEDKPAEVEEGEWNLASQAADDPFASDASAVPANPQIDYNGFVELAVSERDERAKRRVPLEKFLEMSAEPNTIILDTRSKAAFDAAHLKGAVHLNFSDFTEPKLAKVIPDKNTRVLIYCNNNFIGPATVENTNSPAVELMQLRAKDVALALNIPTFINLRGYGYPNIYELADAIAVDDPRVTFEGSAVERAAQQIAAQSFNGG